MIVSSTFLPFLSLEMNFVASANVLIDDEIRAVITGFGLSKTCCIMSACTQRRHSYAGRALAWTAPEMFKPRPDKRSNFNSTSDVYSFGIICWEVLVSEYGPPHNSYWMGKKMSDLVADVVKGTRPGFPDGFNPENVLHGPAHAKMMERCLQEKPKMRPTFKEIVGRYEKWGTKR
mmetsp:Transcript_11657/g.17406  ORF Transcript_11657/g.17406 Transcript_11657/m.17406 type:complete len:175 (+) Transcript_11657:34-558(+)